MRKYISLLVILPLVLSSCTYAPQVDVAPQMDALNNEIKVLGTEKGALIEKVAELEAELALIVPEEESVVISASLLSTGLTVMDLIKTQDYAGLATYIHPTEGLRFSPYAYVSIGSDLVFTSAQVADFASDSTVYNWGSFDGTGDPIQLNFNDYYAKFVYDEDYMSPHMIGNNVLIGTGNTINNVTTVYPSASFVEFHFTGFDPQYDGLDWASLRLIFENVSGTWLLIGIEHDGWTI